MKKRLMAYLVLLALLLLASQTYAQGSPWSAWLYEQLTGTMTLVNSDGAVLDNFVLPSEVGYSYSRNVSVSDNGNLFAYVVSSGADPFPGFLYIYDRAADDVRYAFEMDSTPTHSLDFSASNLNFSADGTTFAFSYANSDMSRWWILSIDLTVFTVEGIRGSDPLPLSLGLRSDFLLPVVQYNRDGQVIVTTVFLATEGLPEYDAYTWDVAATTMTPNPVYRTLNTDTFLPTGEVIFPLEDARLPMDTSEAFMFFQLNTLQVYDPAIGGRYPFYTDSTTSFYSARFVQGGERILAGSANAEGVQSWSLLERNGTLVGEFTADNPYSTAGVLDGFLYTSNNLDSERRPQLLFVNTRDGLDASETGAAIWTGAIRDSLVSVVWTSDLLAVGTTPVTAWAQLAAPVDPLVDVPDTADAAPAGPLTVGGRAVINTTGGDQLNVRSGAGTNFAIVVPLDAGTVVTILEGPVDANGFTWWRIRTDNGVEGWVIESIDDNGTRIQTLVPG